MISFHKAEAADRVWAHEILKNCEYPGAEYAFSCMYLWSDYFGELGRVGDHLTQHASWRGREVYLYPAGAGDIKGAIEAIRADAAERGGPLRLRSLTKDKKEELEALYPGKFEFTACRNSYDYIYTVEELSELHGKKLQSKRNHCNRFEDEFPDWFTAPITDDNLPQCHEMLRVWYETHEPAVNAQELDQLQLEKTALQRAFDHFDELEMDGLLLSDGERIIAFSMGSRMNRDYYDVGFEKAFPDVNGAYAMINREFSRMIAEKYPEVQFLNREDDMGSEGLRRAKESYQPTVLLEKYVADWKENSACACARRIWTICRSSRRSGRWASAIQSRRSRRFLPSLTLRRPASARRRTGGSSPRPTRCRRSSPGASARRRPRISTP